MLPHIDVAYTDVPTLFLAEELSTKRLENRDRLLEFSLRGDTGKITHQEVCFLYLFMRERERQRGRFNLSQVKYN